MSNAPSADFWRGRRVFLTGHTGFKGAWMFRWLSTLGAEVTGYSLPPHTNPSLWALTGDESRSSIGDIRDFARLRNALVAAAPQVVVHMAAQALVRVSYRDPLSTYATNVQGTGHVLDACRDVDSLQAVVVVTSDKVYENDNGGRPFSETDRLGGHDPYSNSKACAELLTACYRDSFFAGGPPIATVRAGNVIGGGDWSEDRLIPDCIRAIAAGHSVSLRHPQAVRPWQHVLEPLSGYLLLAQALVENQAVPPRAVNFGPDPSSFCTVSDIVDMFSESFSGKPGWSLDGSSHPSEATALTLSSQLATSALGWRPRFDVKTSLAWTAAWYRAHADGNNMADFTTNQLRTYVDLWGA